MSVLGPGRLAAVLEVLDADRPDPGRQAWLADQLADPSTAAEVLRHRHREELLRTRLAVAVRPARRRRWNHPGVAAALVAMAIGSAGLSLGGYLAPRPPPDPYAVAAGPSRLDDGSRITVSPEGTVTVDHDPAGGIALTLDRGAVTCQVVPQTDGRHFTVSTVQGIVTVVGTAFTVDQQDGATLVTVTSGRVDVLDRNSRTVVVLGAGERVRLHPPCLPEKTSVPPTAP